MSPLFENIQSIAIVRALQLGDLLCAVPAWRALRAAYPNAHIALIGLPWAKEFVKRFSHYIDEYIEWPGLPGFPERPWNSKEILNFIGYIQKRQFDLVIQMQGNGYILNPFIELFDARYTAGLYESPGAFRPNYKTFFLYPKKTSEILQHLYLMEQLGIPHQGTDIDFPLTDEDKKQVDALHLPLQPHHYVCIHPGARAMERVASPQWFAELADSCTERGYSIIITGVEKEAARAEMVLSLMKHSAINLVGKTTLGMVAQLIKNARLLITNDTGVSHIAAATKTPSIIFSLSDDPERWAPLNKELHHFLIIQKK